MLVLTYFNHFNIFTIFKCTVKYSYCWIVATFESSFLETVLGLRNIYVPPTVDPWKTGAVFYSKPQSRRGSTRRHQVEIWFFFFVPKCSTVFFSCRRTKARGFYQSFSAKSFCPLSRHGTKYSRQIGLEAEFKSEWGVFFYRCTVGFLRSEQLLLKITSCHSLLHAGKGLKRNRNTHKMHCVWHTHTHTDPSCCAGDVQGLVTFF